MRCCALVLATLLVSVIPVFAQDRNQKTLPTYTAESSAYVVEGHEAWTYVTENRSFQFEEVLGDSGNYEAVLLLEQTYHNERTPGLEGT